MDKQTIIDYVMHTPHNTNPAVLEDMLIQLEEGGSTMNTWDGIFYVSENEEDGSFEFEFEGDEEALREWIDDPISVYKKYCIVMEDDFSHIDPGSAVCYCEVTGITKAENGGDPVVTLSFVPSAPDANQSLARKLDITSILSPSPAL